MKKVLILFILLAAAATTLAGVSPKDIYKQYRETICLITYYQNIASDSRIGSFNKIKRHRTGILVSNDGLVMASSDIYPVSLDMVSGANSMLSGKPSDFKIKLSDGTEYPAEFLGKDDQAQTALIRLTDLPENKKFPYVSFVSTEKYGIADSVYCLELLPQYYDFQPLFTPHLINAVIESPRRKFLINNYTTGLSAGGLVLDSQGQAIGITLGQDIDFSFHPPTEFEELRKDYLEIAPSEWFAEFIQNPPESENDHTGQKAWLGIKMQGLSRELQAYWKVPQSGGIIINKVYPESPASKAGLQTGDIILAINDSALHIQKDEDTRKFQEMILAQSPGSSVKFKVFRNGKTFTSKIPLAAAPKSIVVAESYPVPRLGFEIRELTRDVIYEDDLPLETPGVFVYQVDRASPAGQAGLGIGDIIQQINEKPIENLESARKIIENELEPTEKIMFKVLSGRTTRFIFIDLKK